MYFPENIDFLLEASIYLIYGLVYIHGFVRTFFINSDHNKMKHLYTFIGIGMGLICMFLIVKSAIIHNYPINNIGVFLSPFLTLLIAYIAWRAIIENRRVSKQGDNIKLIIDNDKMMYSNTDSENEENIQSIYGIDIKSLGVTPTQFFHVVNSLRASSFYYTIDDGDTKGLSDFRKAFFEQEVVRKIYHVAKGKMFANSRMTSIIDSYLKGKYP